MGMIRKTLSIGTLGLVAFRSKSERLERAEQSLRDAQLARDREALARASAEERAADIADTLKQSRRRRRRDQRRALLSKSADAVAGAGHVIAAVADTAEPGVAELAASSRRLRRRARRKAKRAASNARPCRCRRCSRRSARRDTSS